jgi:hypothetical protein
MWIVSAMNRRIVYVLVASFVGVGLWLLLGGDPWWKTSERLEMPTELSPSVTKTPAPDLINPSVAHTAFVLEQERDPPPYPWPVPPGPSDVASVLERRRVSFRFDQTPFLMAVAYIAEVHDLTITLEPEVRRLVTEKDLKVTLKLNDISLENALRLILAADDDLVFAVTPTGVVIRMKRKEPEKPEEPRPPPPFSMGRWIVEETERERSGSWPAPPNNRWRWDLRRALESKRMSGNFASTPLPEFVTFVSELTRLNITIGRSIDIDKVKVTYRCTERSVGDVLRDVLGPHGLAVELGHETVSIVPASLAPLHDDPEPLPRLRDRTVPDFVGVTVPELVSAFAKQGIDLHPTERAWVSRGTFSFVCSEEPFGKALAALSKGGELEAWIDFHPVEPPREIVLLDGELASVNDALLRAVPDYRGVKATVSELRTRLESEVTKRRALRASRPIDRQALYSSEHGVDGQARQILKILDRVAALALAPARLAELKGALAAAQAKLAAAARDPHLAPLYETRVERLSREIEQLEKDVSLLRRLEAGEPLPPD